MREIQGTGPRVRSPPARPGEKDETADKRVESFRVPCLDAGSTPATSTVRRRSGSPGRRFFVRAYRSERPGMSPGRSLCSGVENPKCRLLLFYSGSLIE